MGEIVLYGSIYSRTFTAPWILAELGRRGQLAAASL